MKKFLQIAALALPMIAMAQSWNFDDNTVQGWAKTTGPFALSASGGVLNFGFAFTGGATSAVSPTTLVIGNSTSTVPNPTSYRFLKVVMTNNNTPIIEVAFRGDNTLTTTSTPTVSSPANTKKLAIDKTVTGEQTYMIDLDGLTTFTGAAGKYELRFSKTNNTTEPWTTSQSISINSIDFLPDVIKNVHTFDAADYWTADNTNTVNNSSTATFSGGSMVIAPTGGVNAKVRNDQYSVDASNKYVHIVYTNNSTNNNSLRVGYNDTVGNTYSLPAQPLATVPLTGKGITSVSGEVVIDASAISTWTGTVRKITMVLTNVDGTGTSVPASVDASTLSIDSFVINNSSTLLSTSDVSKAKNLLQVYVSENTLNFRNANVSKATIFNMNGQLVKDAKVQNNAVDVSNLKAGVYMVKSVAQDNTETVTKFIKK